MASSVNAPGGELLYSTYLGGACADVASAVAVDPDSNADVTSQSASPNLPLRISRSPMSLLHSNPSEPALEHS